FLLTGGRQLRAWSTVAFAHRERLDVTGFRYRDDGTALLQIGENVVAVASDGKETVGPCAGPISRVAARGAVVACGRSDGVVVLDVFGQKPLAIPVLEGPVLGLVIDAYEDVIAVGKTEVVRVAADGAVKWRQSIEGGRPQAITRKVGNRSYTFKG